MTQQVPFHFLLLAVGEILKLDNIVTPQDIQDFIALDEAFGGYRVPLVNCRLALQLLTESQFVEKVGKNEYVRYQPDFKITKLEEEKEIPQYGDLMTLEKFIESSSNEYIIDYDGFGYYSNGKVMWTDKRVYPSDVRREKIIKNPKFTHIVWFNR